MTGQGRKDLVLAAWEERADFHIDKPFDFVDLQKRKLDKAKIISFFHAIKKAKNKNFIEHYK